MPTTRTVIPALLAALLLSSPAAAGTEPDTAAGVDVVHVGPWVESGGYPTTGWGWDGLMVAFTDSSPGSGHVYTVTVTPVEGGAPVTASWEAFQGWDGGTVPLQVGGHDDFPLGSAYTVSVAEHDGDTLLGATEPRHHLHEVVGHPDRGVLGHQRAGGPDTVRAGSKVRLRWSGSWEVGTSLTQVVYAVKRDGTFGDRDVLFCEGSWCPTRQGVRWVKGGDEPLQSFRVPERLAGKELLVVSYGSLTNKHGHLKTQWGWQWQLKIRRG